MSERFSAGDDCGEISVEIENIGGIERVERTIQPGITILSGRNATNRTSFLQGMMSALGSDSDQITLRSNASEGRARLEIQTGEGTQTYTRRLSREDGRVVATGEPYADDATLIDLYAFLLRENDVRRVVEQNGDLREVLMRPVDTEELTAELETKRTRRRRLKSQLDDEKQNRLEALKTEQTALEDDIEELESTRNRLQKRCSELEQVESAEPDRNSDIEDRLRELRDRRHDLDRQISMKRSQIEGAKEDIAEIDVPETDSEKIRERRADLDAELDSIDEELQTVQAVKSELSDLQNAARSLRDTEHTVDRVAALLDEPGATAPLTNGGVSDGDTPTDALVESTVRCSVCGSVVPEETIESILSEYNALTEQLSEKELSLKRRREEIESDRKQLEEQLDRIQKNEDRIAAAERTIRQAETDLERLEAERSDIDEQIEAVEAELDAGETPVITESTREYNEKRDELREIEAKLSKKRQSLATVAGKVQSVEARRQERARTERRIEEITEEIESLESKVERTERRLVSKFNEQMETVLDVLGYGNVERIWLERRASADDEASFDLHIVREGAEGVYECRLEHLSESERTVTGLVVALTGYLVHDVAEACPLVLIDSIETIDGARIAALLEYLSARTKYLLVALLPDDRKAVCAAEEIDETVLEFGADDRE